MGQKERFNQDLREAQLKRQELKVSVLRLLLASCTNREIEKRTKLSKTEPVEKLEELSRLNEEEILEVVAKEAKKRKEAIAAFEKGKREDLALKEREELEILQGYLPEQLPDEEIVKLVKEAIQKTGAKTFADMGRVMAELMPKIKGRADASRVSKITKEIFSKD